MPLTSFPADVGVGIVAHNNRDKLAVAIPSLEAAGCPHRSIRVVDVASTDGTREWLKAAYPDIDVVTLDRNDGPSPGRNVAIRACEHPFIFLMDADVIVEPDTIQRLHAAMIADPSVKVGSPIVVHANAPDRIQYAGGSLHYICEAINPWMDRPLAERGNAPANIGAAPTCGLLLDRAAAIDVGLFDERYFIGKEDGDFTHRICLAGFHIRELPEARLRHYSRPRGTWLFYYQIRNRWHFILKNYQWRTMICIIPPLLVYEPLQLVVLHLHGHGRTYWRAVGGLLAMLPALPRDRALTRRIRRVPDGALLKSDRLIVRDDLARNPIVRIGKGIYEAALGGYWRLLRATVLRG